MGYAKKTIDKDLIPSDKWGLEEFLEDNNKQRNKPLNLSIATFWRGLVDLENAQIMLNQLG